jgi:hypothetical protein
VDVSGDTTMAICSLERTVGAFYRQGHDRSRFF